MNTDFLFMSRSELDGLRTLDLPRSTVLVEGAGTGESGPLATSCPRGRRAVSWDGRLEDSCPQRAYMHASNQSTRRRLADPYNCNCGRRKKDHRRAVDHAPT
jgi:hypothetical protein